MTRRSLASAIPFLLAAAPAFAQQPPPPAPPPPSTPPPVVAKNPPAPPATEAPLQLSGSLPDSAKAAAAPPSRVITTDKEWAALMLAWGIKDPPKVDFKQQFLVVATTRGDQLKLDTELDKAGDLRITALDTTEVRGGFRYSIRALKRAGVKTVDGKALPAGD